jgi:hypothetical protein
VSHEGEELDRASTGPGTKSVPRFQDRRKIEKKLACCAFQDLGRSPQIPPNSPSNGEGKSQEAGTDVQIGCQGTIEPNLGAFDITLSQKKEGQFALQYQGN